MDLHVVMYDSETKAVPDLPIEGISKEVYIEIYKRLALFKHACSLVTPIEKKPFGVWAYVSDESENNNIK